jgi:hypothetical protein
MAQIVGHPLSAQIAAILMICWGLMGIVHRRWRIVAAGLAALFAALAGAADLYLLAAAWTLLTMIVGLSEVPTFLKSKSHG